MIAKLREVKSERPPVILASASQIRATLLANAGVAATCRPADIDEGALRADMSRDGPPPPPEVALALAHAKAAVIAGENDGAIVIGADQVLALDGEIFEKPASIGAARLQLMRLRGRPHRLISAFVCRLGDRVLTEQVSSAELVMRDFTDAFLDRYMEEAGEAVLHSVGAYQLEGPGAQLFEHIDGDYFTILGLPMLPLLAVLRRAGVLVE
jgi:septum formation protein